MSKIQKLEVATSHKLCTGQVVVTLAGACRELIDNAIDAGATQIDIRVKENGVESLEVSDNGSGIEEHDFEFLCKPHCTSKLTKISDFDALTTFGFRGEALNSLASLSENLQLITRHGNARCGTKLSFTGNGEILSHEASPRSVGTTITLTQLFKPLPVRRQELNRRARAEFLKLLECVQSFALSRTDIRFSCLNTLASKRVQMLSSPGGNATVSNVIASIFGTEKGTDVLALTEALPNDEVLKMYGLVDDDRRQKIFKEIRLSGYVSTCEFGQGRSTADRQFVFVNHRPVDFAKLCRIANEVYNVYNRGRYCLLVLFVEIPPSTVDVNISPDKRTVFLHHEKEVFAKFRATLLATFSKIQGRCPMAPNSTNVASNRKRPYKPLTSWEDDEDDENDLERAANISVSSTQMSTASSHLRFMDIEETDKSEELMDEGDQFETSRDQTFDTNFEMALDSDSGDKTQSPRLTLPVRMNKADLGKKNDERKVPAQKAARLDRTPQTVNTGVKKNNAGGKLDTSFVRNSIMKTLEAFSFQRLKSPGNQQEALAENNNRQGIPSTGNSNEVLEQEFAQPTCSAEPTDVDAISPQHLITISTRTTVLEEQLLPDKQSSSIEQCQQIADIIDLTDPNQDISVDSIMRPEQTLVLDIGALQNKFIKKMKKRLCKNTAAVGDQIFAQNNENFLSMNIEVSKDMIGDETNSDEATVAKFKEKAEEHLSLILNKNDFENMEIIGQFNDAFIITRVKSELFIVDQHAADEKYNFEQLQSRAKIDSQPLIMPQPLHLGAVNEAIITDNSHVFIANGFNFSMDHDANPGQRICLTAVPTLRKWHFNKDDIDELVAALLDFPGVMHRPSKLRKIFASNACRKSVMFGDPLGRQKMEEIVRHMGRMHQPWNCPHGRPTIRHLASLHQDDIQS